MGTHQLFEAAALGDEEAGGLPLEEEDDRAEHEDLAEHGIAEDLLERLIDDADAERADDRAEDIADAADDHGHEGIDDVVLAEAGADIADLREERAGQSGEAAAEGRR